MKAPASSQNLLWTEVLECLQNTLSNEDFDHWILPLQAMREPKLLTLFAPN